MFLIFFYLIILCSGIRLKQWCSNDSDISGYFWDGQQCLSCKSQQCYCSEPQGCNSCQSQYYLSSQQTCELCPTGCSNCCENQYEIQIVCTKCQDNYKLVQGVCIFQKGCLSFTKHGRCAKCNQNGYFLSSVGICESCSNGCQYCYTDTHCVGCYPGYIGKIQYVGDTPTIVCEGCELQNFTGCAFCTYADAKYTVMYCQTCLSGYYQTQEYQCFQCLSHCQVCEDPRQEPQICVTCFDNYILSQNETQCQDCRDAFPYCSACTTQQIGLIKSFICLVCESGYYLDQGECVSCWVNNSLQIGYLFCDSPTSPTQCQAGYLLVNASDNSTQCLVNQYNCRTMDDQSDCLTCQGKDYLYKSSDSDQIQCVQCSSIIENCQDCTSLENNQLKCQNCETSYYLLTSGQCVACSDQCLQCSQDTCLVCDDTYYVSDNICHQCPENFCKTCAISTDKLKCTECLEGYGVTPEGSCWSCQMGCAKCDNNQTQCQNCTDNYFFNESSKICFKYPDNCLQVYQNGTCQLCETLTNQSSNGMKQSFFYQTEGGICRLCNDFDSGQFSCPSYCQSSPEFNVTYVYSNKLKLIGLIYLIVFF